LELSSFPLGVRVLDSGTELEDVSNETIGQFGLDFLSGLPGESEGVSKCDGVLRRGGAFGLGSWDGGHVVCHVVLEVGDVEDGDRSGFLEGSTDELNPGVSGGSEAANDIDWSASFDGCEDS